MEITQVKETCLYIKDLEKAITFYNQILEFPLYSYQKGRHAFFRVGSSMLLCFNPDDSKTKKSPPAHFAEGKQHIAFEVSEKDFDSSMNQLKNKGITVIDEVIWRNNQKSFYFEDPAGNILEIVPYGVWE